MLRSRIAPLVVALALVLGGCAGDPPKEGPGPGDLVPEPDPVKEPGDYPPADRDEE